MTKKYYITTPIYYVNDKPHIGHAYTTLIADSFARYNRAMGREVHFLTGTDEHGEKVDRTAKEKGKDTLEHIEEMVSRFKDLWKALHITNDDFIRTTEERHIKTAQKILTTLYEKGDVYKGEYKGWYCTPCETFWTETQLEEGNCPDCKRETAELAETNYFFKMSAYQDWLIDYIKAHENFIRPKGKENEVLSFLKEPLEDLCISRPKARLSWGISLPFDEDHVLYVWFDALINYLTATNYLEDDVMFESLWPADIHFIAKDILRFHCIYWPIMLHALNVALPKTVMVHGFWTMEGEKMSKSKGNIADPYDIMNIYGNDALRYYLYSEITLGQDGAYADQYVIERYNSNLANDLGNLVHRSFSMLEKYRGGLVPSDTNVLDKEDIKTLVLALGGRIQKAMDVDCDPRLAMNAIWEVVGAANKFIEETKPWALAKADDTDKLDDFLYSIMEMLRFIACALGPFLPETAKKLNKLLTQEEKSASRFDSLREWGGMRTSEFLEKGEPLFPRIEDE